MCNLYNLYNSIKFVIFLNFEILLQQNWLNYEQKTKSM